jgi:hypothetical protein
VIAILIIVLRIVISLVLYVFLGFTLWSFWRDLQSDGRVMKPGTQAFLELIVHHDGETMRYQSRGAFLKIGRDPANDCTIQDATVSAFHAQLEFHHNQWWFSDLESRNGSYLNQQPVQDAVVVTSGDQLRCGSVLIDLYIKRAD